MKILRVTTLLDFGGQEKQYLSFTEKTILLKHDYIFAAIGFGGNAQKVLKQRGFAVHVLNRKFSIRNLSNIFAIYQLIKKIKPDIVHTAAAEANFHGIIAAKLAGVKIIIAEEIGIPNHSSLAQKIFRLVYKFASKVICVSQSVKNHLVLISEISATKGKVIYNPVSVPKSFPKITSDKLEVVYVGRLEKVKNVEMVIIAFSKIDEANIHLTIVGDGKERQHLESLTTKLGQSSRITFSGFNSEPSRFLSSADLFILPSFSEGFGIAAVEAMFLKIPVLCSNVGGIPEFVTNNRNGWLFNPNDVEGLTSKLRMIIDMNKEERGVIGNQGYLDVRDRFTTEIYIETLERFYEEMHNS